ncbi:MAG: ribbon-helix-helix domain-containing protein [Dehalococcoidia bacterium]
MKTTISIPDELFAQARQAAERTNKSRSQLFSDALREYLARHATPDEITEAMDRAMARLEAGGEHTDDGFTRAAARRVLVRSEW